MSQSELPKRHSRLSGSRSGAGRVLRGLSMTCEFRKWLMILLFCFVPTEIISQPSSKAFVLVSQSDFIGFVQANPMVSDPQSDWRQLIYLSEVDPLKGSLTRDPRTKEFPLGPGGPRRKFRIPDLLRRRRRIPGVFAYRPGGRGASMDHDRGFPCRISAG